MESLEEQQKTKEDDKGRIEASPAKIKRAEGQLELISKGLEGEGRKTCLNMVNASKDSVTKYQDRS